MEGLQVSLKEGKAQQEYGHNGQQSLGSIFMETEIDDCGEECRKQQPDRDGAGLDSRGGAGRDNAANNGLVRQVARPKCKTARARVTRLIHFDPPSLNQ